jgi:zinc transporter ZupT
MLGASHNLIAEGTRLDPGRVLVGILAGLAAIVVANRLIRRHQTVEIAELHGASARKALLLLGGMTAHSLAEGVGVGVSFGGAGELGAFITTAIAIHNIPEGLAICLVLIPRGTSIIRAAAWSIFTSLPQPLMAVPAYIFVSAFEPFLPVGLGLAAGAMISMVFAELRPGRTQECRQQQRRHHRRASDDRLVVLSTLCPRPSVKSQRSRPVVSSAWQ